ncbi:MAG: CBS domain-containing protein [Verrucomicrobia bacterium]|nr:CBS domain-containing protein [Verrucomicrobiota bacterium]
MNAETYTVDSILHNKSHASVWSVTPSATVFDAIKMMADKNVGALLVMEGERLIGVMSERDYTRKVALKGKSSKQTPVRDIMPDRVISVTPQHSIQHCMKLMTENRIRHLPVLDGARVVGLVSIGDLVNWIISVQSSAISQMESYIMGGYSG